MATRIGCDHLVYVAMTAEETATTAPAYGDIKNAIGVISLNINPNGSQETLFADDGPMETASTLGKIEVEINKSELTTQNKADLLGHKIDSNGALVYSANDVAPWVGIGFRTLKSNGHYRYVWLYKGKFTEPEDQNETKGDSINFQTDTISGQFARLSYPYMVDGTETYPWKYELDQDTDNANAAVINAWFDQVMVPNVVINPTPAAALTATFASGTASGTTKATITGTLGTGNHYAYKISTTQETTPNTSDTVTGVTTYTSGNDIPGVNATTNKYLSLYELTAANKAVKFLAHTVLSSEIAS